MQFIEDIFPPDITDNLRDQVTFPYVTTAPSGKAPSGTRKVYYNGTNYFLYIYVNGGWRYVQLT